MVGGVRIRFWQYDDGSLLPRWVKDALDNGYTIVHKSLLCSTPVKLLLWEDHILKFANYPGPATHTRTGSEDCSITIERPPYHGPFQKYVKYAGQMLNACCDCH